MEIDTKAFDKNESCTTTFKTSREKSKLVAKVHKIAAPIECPYQNCHYSVSRKDCLTRHIKMVHDRIKEECKNCGKKVSYTNMCHHVKRCTSDGSRNFECPEKGCGASFQSSTGRLYHIRDVHKEPIECPFPGCGAVMKEKSLPKHAKRVHAKVKEECGNCGKKYTYGSLTGHLKKCHPPANTQ